MLTEFHDARDLYKFWWSTARHPVAGCVMLAIAVGLSAWFKGRFTVKVSRLLVAILGTFTGIMMGIVPQQMMSCYMRGAMAMSTSRAIAKQSELIERYHKNGVINDETYRRLIGATTDEARTQ